MNKCSKCDKEIEGLTICNRCKEIELNKLKKINKILTVFQIILIILAASMYICYCMDEECDNNDDKVIMSEQQLVANFNSKFLVYVGKNKTLAQVRALINMVLANNVTNVERQVKINNNTNTKDIISKLHSLPSDNYEITANPNFEGYITNVNITDSKGKLVFEEENDG